MTEPRVEVRLAVDPAVGPLADGHDNEITVLVADDSHLWVELVLPVERARQWAAELFTALTVAYHDATGGIDVWPLTPTELIAWADGTHDDRPLY